MNKIQMNDDLRISISRICDQLSLGLKVNPDDVNRISAELKKMTGTTLSEDDHLLYMKFHYELAKRETMTMIHRLPFVDTPNYGGWGFDTVEQMQKAHNAALLKRYGLFAMDSDSEEIKFVAEETLRYNK